MRFECLDAPIIKGVGEEKFAFHATTVIDGHARQRKENFPPIFARSIKINDAEERSLAATDFATGGRLRHRLETIDHSFHQRGA